MWGVISQGDFFRKEAGRFLRRLKATVSSANVYEEALCKQVPDSNKRAYAKLVYTLGQSQEAEKP